MWRRFARKGEVTAERLDAAVAWVSASSGETLRAGAGDWKLWDDDPAEFWTIKDDAFRSSYVPVGDGRYRRTGEVEIRESIAGETLLTLEGSDVEQEGHFVVRDAAGAQWQITPSKLETAYEPLDCRSGE